MIQTFAKCPQRRDANVDRDLALQQLSQAELHFSEGARHLARQEALIAMLDHHGRNTTDARKLLVTLRDCQTLHEQEIQHLLKLLK